MSIFPQQSISFNYFIGKKVPFAKKDPRSIKKVHKKYKAP